MGEKLPERLVLQIIRTWAVAQIQFPDSDALNPKHIVALCDAALEGKPDCWCLTCRPITVEDMRFVVCPDCGNKRCPKANDHRHDCTGSNEPGQKGSAWEGVGNGRG